MSIERNSRSSRSGSMFFEENPSACFESINHTEFINEKNDSMRDIEIDDNISLTPCIVETSRNLTFEQGLMDKLLELC